MCTALDSGRKCLDLNFLCLCLCLGRCALIRGVWNSTSHVPNSPPILPINELNPFKLNLSRSNWIKFQGKNFPATRVVRHVPERPILPLNRNPRCRDPAHKFYHHHLPNVRIPLNKISDIVCTPSPESKSVLFNLSPCVDPLPHSKKYHNHSTVNFLFRLYCSRAGLHL